MNPQTGPSLLTMRILWGALTMTVLIFAVVLVVTGHLSPTPGPGPDAVMGSSFLVMAFVTPAVGEFLARAMYARAVAAANLATRQGNAVERAGASVGFRDAAASTEAVFADPVTAERTALRCAMSPMILRLATSEAVAQFGFVYAFLGAGLAKAAPFFALAFVLMVLRVPSLGRYRADLERATGARFPAAQPA